MKKFGLVALGITAANRCPCESRITSRTCLFRINCICGVPLLQKEHSTIAKLFWGGVLAHRFINSNCKCTCFHRNHRTHRCSVCLA